jgi:hypothetical protein
MIRVKRENRNRRDLEIRQGDLIQVVGLSTPARSRGAGTRDIPPVAALGLVIEIGAGDTCPDYVIAVFPHLGETVVYADEWEVINA